MSLETRVAKLEQQAKEAGRTQGTHSILRVITWGENDEIVAEHFIDGRPVPLEELPVSDPVAVVVKVDWTVPEPEAEAAQEAALDDLALGPDVPVIRVRYVDWPPG